MEYINGTENESRYMCGEHRLDPQNRRWKRVRNADNPAFKDALDAITPWKKNWTEVAEACGITTSSRGYRSPELGYANANHASCRVY